VLLAAAMLANLLPAREVLQALGAQALALR
jgi:hypothetical protein